MADFVFNVAKGAVRQYYDNIAGNTPANSALIIVPVDAGATTDATIIDFATLSAVLAGGVTERTTGNWNRKTLTDANTIAYNANTSDRVDLDIPDQTWTTVTAGTVTDLLICYDADTTTGTDANIIPLTFHDFAVTPDGSDVVAQIAATGFYRAA